MENCIFCKIIRKEIPSNIIYEDEISLAFLDAKPNNPGHTLLLPKEHYENIFDIPENLYGEVQKRIVILGKAISSAVKASGINTSSNNGAVAGQLVFHAHTHLIPRFENDGLKHWTGTPYKEGEAEIIVQKIKSELQF